MPRDNFEKGRKHTKKCQLTIYSRFAKIKVCTEKTLFVFKCLNYKQFFYHLKILFTSSKSLLFPFFNSVSFISFSASTTLPLSSRKSLKPSREYYIYKKLCPHIFASSCFCFFRV